MNSQEQSTTHHREVTQPVDFSEAVRKAMGADAVNGLNSEYDWERFHQQEYVERNYSKAFEADIVLLQKLKDFYETTPFGGSHIEIGIGPNLYPLMTVAPYRDRIEVTDIAASNLDYIKNELRAGLTDTWKRWHSRLQAIHGGYPTEVEMVDHLTAICNFELVSIFDIAEDSHDSSSMMFVAESITAHPLEFEAGLFKAVRCVRPGGNFVMALMLNSYGYKTHNMIMPAVPITKHDVQALLENEVREAEYTVIDFNVRAGHEGMLLVTGYR